MKILFLANRLPYPPYRGDKLKIYNLAKRLNARHELHLLTFTETEEDKNYIPNLQKVFKEVHTVHLTKGKGIIHSLKALVQKAPAQVLYFQSAAMRGKLDELLCRNQYDVVHVQHLRMAPYMQHRKDIPSLLDLPDAFSLYWERRSQSQKNPLLKWLEKKEAVRLKKFEAIVKEYRLSLVCSEEDLNYLQHNNQADNIRLLPNGVDVTTFHPTTHDYSRNDIVLFTGNMDYAPNVDAVDYFANDILPLILKQFPKLKFVIAGQRPVAKVKSLANEHIEVTGFVEDLAAVYNEASVVLSPLRFGAGTQNKVLEAMACGVPVVCSHIGFGGLGISSGDGAIMEKEPKAFAQTVCDLLASEEKRKEIGVKGMNVVKERFDWDVIAKRLEGYFETIKDR